MSKLGRQQFILELASKGPLPSQQELCKILARRGYPVTQATLSRDVNELRLVKTSDGYALPSGDEAVEAIPAVSRVVREFVREVRQAQNLLVIKTLAGSAQPVATAIDGEKWPEILGTVAGDDTILVVAQTNAKATQLQVRLQRLQA